MLGTALITTDVVLAAIAAYDYAGGASLIASLKFTVEEEEMLTDLKCLLTAYHATTDAAVDVTFFLDGADLADLADGLVRKNMSTVVGLPGADMIAFEHTLRIPKGEHQLQLHMKSPTAGALTVSGTTHHGYLQARRHSHPATSAANANAKVHGIY